MLKRLAYIRNSRVIQLLCPSYTKSLITPLEGLVSFSKYISQRKASSSLVIELLEAVSQQLLGTPLLSLYQIIAPLAIIIGAITSLVVEIASTTVIDSYSSLNLTYKRSIYYQIKRELESGKSRQLTHLQYKERRTNIRTNQLQATLIQNPILSIFYTFLAIILCSYITFSQQLNQSLIRSLQYAYLRANISGYYQRIRISQLRERKVKGYFVLGGIRGSSLATRPSHLSKYAVLVIQQRRTLRLI